MDEGINQSIDTQVSSAPVEKMLPQSEVNEIVGRVKQEAASRAVENYKRSQQQETQHQNYQEPSRDNSQGISEDRYRKLAAEEAQRLRDEWINDTQQRADEQSAQRIVKNFYEKIEAGKTKYDDFDKVTGDLELKRFPNTVHMLSEFVENSSDVLYELSKNRSKLAQIEMTARDFPQEALHALRRLSESITKNAEATGHREARSPLNQQRPSNVGTDSGGVLSMRDLKLKYRV